MLITSSIGQPQKADTFAPQSPSFVDTAMPVADEPKGATRQFLPGTTVDQKEAKPLKKFLDYVVRPQMKPIAIDTSSVLIPRQLWEGTVIECHEGSFVGRVSDKTNPNNPDELVTFEFDELSVEDQRLVRQGASFYWTVGTEQTRAGQIKNVDMLNFRRLPNWSTSAVREAEKRAHEIAALLFTE